MSITLTAEPGFTRTLDVDAFDDEIVLHDIVEEDGQPCARTILAYTRADVEKLVALIQAALKGEA